MTYEDRLHVLYREGERTLRVAAEFLATPGVVLETRSIRAWEAPHASEPVDQELVVRRVKEALEFSGLDVCVDET